MNQLRHILGRFVIAGHFIGQASIGVAQHEAIGNL
jgi:hypothetical protein